MTEGTDMVLETLARRLRRLDSEPEVWACLVEEDSPLFPVLSREESQVFPEGPELFGGANGRFAFIAVVSIAEERLLHGMRLSLPNPDDPASRPFFVDDMVASGQGLSVDEVRSWYAARGVRLNRCASVESLFRVEKLRGVRAAFAGYVALFHLAHRLGCGDGVLAHLNKSSRFSFRRAGLEFEPLLGRNDLRTPSIHGGFDPAYEPVYISLGEQTHRAISAIADHSVGLWISGTDEQVVRSDR